MLEKEIKTLNVTLVHGLIDKWIKIPLLLHTGYLVGVQMIIMTSGSRILVI